MGPRRWAAVLIFTVLLAGCAARHWTRPDTTAQQFEQDSWDCARASSAPATRAGVGGGVGFYRSEVVVNKDLYQSCLRVRGYRQVEGGPFVGVRD